LNIVIVLFGLIGYKFLGVRDYPALDPPNISVRTSYPGANAEIIETQITEPLEKAVNGIPGNKKYYFAEFQGSSNYHR
jgi:multidrug efflux pump subunit AcrB